MNILQQKAPNEFMTNNLNTNNKSNFRNAQHIIKLLSYLNNPELNTNSNKILESFSHYILNDPVLKSIFESYDWSEQSRCFNQEIRTNDLLDKLYLNYKLDNKYYDLNHPISQSKFVILILRKRTKQSL